MTRPSLAALCLPLWLICAAPVSAQEVPDPVVRPAEEQPIGIFVVDARGVWARFKGNNAIGTALGVDPNVGLPTRGLGLALGAHAYPVRRRSFALGIGAEWLLRAQGSRTYPNASDPSPAGPTVTTRLTAFSPQVSLNFGRRMGYSYLSGGLGSAAFTAERGSAPFAGDAPRVRAINYGAGARWFAQKHVAFSLDLRFYAISPQAATAARPAFPRETVLVFSAGLSAR